MNESAPGHSGDIRGLQLALLAYAVVFAAKLAAYFASGVMALFARAGVLAGSVVSAVLGAAFIVIAARRKATTE